MKKSLMLGILAVFGVSNMANAILLKANDQEFANVGLKLAIWAQNNGKSYTNDQNSTNFSVENARLYFSGQINPIVQFGANIDFADNNGLKPDGSARTHQGVPYTLIKDAFINLKPAQEFQVMTGLFLDPWSRVALGDLYAFIVPLENYNPGVGTINNDLTGNVFGGKSLIGGQYNQKSFINPLVPFTFGSDVGNSFRDLGIAFWGSTPDTMLKYYLFAGNGKYGYQIHDNGKGNLKYGFRIEFAPTFLGYKGESGYVDKDTYLGSLNTMVFSFAYQQQKIDCSPLNNNPTPGGCGTVAGAPSSTTAKAYTVDFLFEQKFGDFVPNFQAAYLDQKDLGYASAGSVVAQPEAQGYYIQTQLLYDRNVGIGKPALVLRYEQDKNKNYYQAVSASGTPLPGFVDAKLSMYDIFFNYYIAGLNANISLGAAITKPDSNLKAATAQYQNGGIANELKSFTDYTLALRTVF